MGKNAVAVSIHSGGIVREFVCARCGDLFATPTSEADANREYLESGQTAAEGIASVCDDCYEYVMARARANGLIIRDLKDQPADEVLCALIEFLAEDDPQLTILVAAGALLRLAQKGAWVER